MSEKIPDTLSDFTKDLINDLHELREGKITLQEARVRAQLAREVLRGVQLQLHGMWLLSNEAKKLGRE